MREAPSTDVMLLAMKAMTGKMENNKKGKASFRLPCDVTAF